MGPMSRVQTDDSPPEAHAPSDRMACLEVRGGNRAIETAFSTQGLDLWVKCMPYGAGPSAERPAPKEAGGGDVHMVSSCATGRITRLLVADLCGHGSTVDAAGRELKRLMGQFSNYIDQSRFIEAVNRSLATAYGAREPTAGLFATAAFATYFAPSGELSLANAGHPPPILYRASTSTWSFLEQDSPAKPLPEHEPSHLPLGILEDTRYPEATIRLHRGDLVLFYSDALIEARSPANVELGMKGLLQIVERADPSRPDGVLATILDAIGAFRGASPVDTGGGVGLHDDLTLLLIRPNALGPRPSMALGIAATLRLAARRIQTLVRHDVAMPAPEWTIRNILGAFLPSANRARS